MCAFCNWRICPVSRIVFIHFSLCIPRKQTPVSIQGDNHPNSHSRERKEGDINFAFFFLFNQLCKHQTKCQRKQINNFVSLYILPPSQKQKSTYKGKQGDISSHLHTLVKDTRSIKQQLFLLQHSCHLQTGILAPNL